MSLDGLLYKKFRDNIIICFCVVLFGCTSNNGVQQTLSPEPVATSQSTASSQTIGASSNQTALAAETNPSSTQNVVDQQLNSNSQATQVAALDPANSISFLPVEGMPQSAVTGFSKSIKASAQAHGLNIAPANQATGRYRVKGYFSALNDGTGTLITYIWDVVDASGKRLHRINGQDRNGSTSVNPWSTVTQNQLNNVANTTASRLKSWLDSRS